jgi:hypothetical protein
MAENLRSQVSGNHGRVISVRLRVLEESCLRLLTLFRDTDSTLTERRALPPAKAQAVERLVRELDSKIAQMKAELGLERAHIDAAREAKTLVTAMAVDIEELHPAYLKGYGEVPEAIGRYLETELSELLRITRELGRTLAGAAS